MVQILKQKNGKEEDNEVVIRNGKTEIAMNKEAISVFAPKREGEENEKAKRAAGLGRDAEKGVRCTGSLNTFAIAGNSESIERITKRQGKNDW